MAPISLVRLSIGGKGIGARNEFVILVTLYEIEGNVPR